MTDYSDAPQPRSSGRGQAAHRRAYGHHPMIRWEALATGSLVGIGAWALAYVVSATFFLGLGCDVHEPGLGWQLLMGLYGCISASFALAVAAYTAARTGGARSQENALFYGVCLWSMSTITLVAVSTLASAQVFSQQMLQAVPILAVGLAAVNLLPSEAGSAPVVTLGAMSATLLISLIFALRGAVRAHTVGSNSERA